MCADIQIMPASFRIWSSTADHANATPRSGCWTPAVRRSPSGRPTFSNIPDGQQRGLFEISGTASASTPGAEIGPASSPGPPPKSAEEGQARWSCLGYLADALANSGRPDISLPF
jgi:hypothetical protein